MLREQFCHGLFSIPMRRCCQSHSNPWRPFLGNRDTNKGFSGIKGIMWISVTPRVFSLLSCYTTPGAACLILSGRVPRKYGSELSPCLYLDLIHCFLLFFNCFGFYIPGLQPSCEPPPCGKSDNLFVIAMAPQIDVGNITSD